MTTVDPGQAPYAPTALRERWRSSSLDSAWLRPGDWYHPAVDALVEALLGAADPTCAARRLGAARGHVGVGITESLDDLLCLYRSRGEAAPPPTVVRALCEGWSAAEPGHLSLGACLDPESGLATREYLATRLGETYAVAERTGVAAAATHCLLMVDVAGAQVSPWERMARSVAVGEALRASYTEATPMAALGGGLFAVLAEQGAALDAGVMTLRRHVAHQAQVLEVTALVRQPPRVWVEQLPASRVRAADLLGKLAR